MRALLRFFAAFCQILYYALHLEVEVLQPELLCNAYLVHTYFAKHTDCHLPFALARLRKN